MADYKNTINLPNTGFPMKADLANREPKVLAQWEQIGVYQKIRAVSKGRPPFIIHRQAGRKRGYIKRAHYKRRKK